MSLETFEFDQTAECRKARKAPLAGDLSWSH